MCGIYGLVWRRAGDGRLALNQRVARAMRESIASRGPDGHGEIVRDGLILGHLRLAIIDLAGGAQPMLGPDGKVALSYNGECYNFPDLMADLGRRGWQFASRCDSEVLLAGYSLMGVDFDEALNGMYAYAILDERGARARVQLATDPVGIKPLFLYQDDDIFLFASELRAIVEGLRAMSKPVEISREGLAAYLRHGWIPAPLTLVENARKLMPGERWQISPGSEPPRLLSIRKRPATTPFQGTSGDLDAALHDTVRRVVGRQTISDVPLGFFFSGGIDSSLLLAVARDLGMEARSFTIGFTGEGHGVVQADETQIARAVAARLGVRLNVIEVDEAVLRGSLSDTFAAMDQPLADPACLPLLLLSRFARDQVKVCLSGDGGDELFAGYPRHRLIGLKHGWGMLPGPARALAARMAAALPERPSSGSREVLRKLRVAHDLVASPAYIDGPFARSVLPSNDEERWNRVARGDACSVMNADIDGQLAGQMLPKTDNMTMAASLECRVPLLDLELIELAASLPMEMKRKGAVGKLPLRRLLAQYVPASISDRPKHGFRVPLTSWFRGTMADEIRDRLGGDLGPLNEFVSREDVGSIVAAHLDGRAEHSIRLWSLLAFESWRDRMRQPTTNF